MWDAILAKPTVPAFWFGVTFVTHVKPCGLRSIDLWLSLWNGWIIKTKKLLHDNILLLPEDNIRRHHVKIPYNFQHYSPVYFSSDPIKKNEMGGACGTYGGEERCVQGFGGETRGKKRQFGSLRHRWEDNIKMDLYDVEWGGMDWIELAKDRNMWLAFWNAVMNLQIP